MLNQYNEKLVIQFFEVEGSYMIFSDYYEYLDYLESLEYEILLNMGRVDVKKKEFIDLIDRPKEVPQKQIFPWWRIFNG